MYPEHSHRVYRAPECGAGLAGLPLPVDFGVHVVVCWPPEVPSWLMPLTVGVDVHSVR